MSVLNHEQCGVALLPPRTADGETPVLFNPATGQSWQAEFAATKFILAPDGWGFVEVTRADGS
eukprot:7456128-Lingulodinium_polyedra.AAC.1